MNIRNLILTAAIVLSMASAKAQTGGTCGDGVEWEITGTAPNQTLTISYTGSGTGEMTNYYMGDFAPWFSQRANLTTLVIDNGVTTIGSSAFYNCSGFTGSLTIPASVLPLRKVCNRNRN